MASLGLGRGPDRSVSCEGPGCGRLLGSFESTGLERCVSGFSAARVCAAVSWHRARVLQPPHHRLEQKPDVLAKRRPPVVRTAARNDKTSRGNGKQEHLSGFKDEMSKYRLYPSFSTCFRQGSEQADSVRSEDAVSCQHVNSLRQKKKSLAWTFASDLSDFALFRRAACPELHGSSIPCAGLGSA